MGKYRGTSRFIGAWHYAFLNLLYLIPVIGWGFLIAHAANNSNENRCHFARSYFTRPLLMLLVLLLACAIAYLVIGADEVSRISGELPGVWEKFISVFEKQVGAV